MSTNRITRRGDSRLYFAEGLTLTATGYTSELDLDSVHFPKGKPIEIFARLNSITGSAATSVQFAIVSGTATAPTTVIQTMPALTAAGEQSFVLPPSASRYVRLSVILTGSAASSANVTALAHSW